MPSKNKVRKAQGGAAFVPPLPGSVGVVLESDLAKRLGLPARKLLDWRRHHGRPSLDWYHDGQGSNCRIVWTEAGLTALNEALNVNLAAVAPLGETVTVVRTGFTNKRIIQCQRCTGEVINVSVRDSSNYRPFTTNHQPMKVKARWTGQSWVAEGRSPRYPGRY